MYGHDRIFKGNLKHYSINASQVLNPPNQNTPKRAIGLQQGLIKSRRRAEWLSNQKWALNKEK